jgi:hypothetical protein
MKAMKGGTAGCCEQPLCLTLKEAADQMAEPTIPSEHPEAFHDAVPARSARPRLTRTHSLLRNPAPVDLRLRIIHDLLCAGVGSPAR